VTQLLGQSLLSVCLNCPPESSKTTSSRTYFERPVLRCPNIRHVAVELPWRSASSVEAFLGLLPNLQSASVKFDYDQGNSQTLSHSPELTSLEQHGPPEIQSIPFAPRSAWKTDTFPHLTLVITIGSNRSLDLRNSNLDSLHLAFNDIWSYQPWLGRPHHSNLMNMLGQVQRSRLTALRISCCNLEHTHLVPIQASNLHNLSTFVALKTLAFDCLGGIRITDAAVSQLLSYCPGLKHLTLGRNRLDSVHITCTAVSDILRACRNLESLVLGFDATSVHAHVCNRSLKRWDILWAPLLDQLEVARFIKRVAPCLEQVHYVSPDTQEPEDEPWRNVVDMVLSA
jgi:hypothetical protein